jgi:hypothetical protein
MAVVSMMRFPGDPDDLARRVNETVDPVSSRLAPKHGGLANIVARTDDGILVINLWEHEEGRHTMAAEPEVQEAVRSAGLPPPDFEGFEVITLRVTGRLSEVAETVEPA